MAELWSWVIGVSFFPPLAACIRRCIGPYSVLIVCALFPESLYVAGTIGHTIRYPRE